MAEVTWSPQAIGDLESIRSHVSRNSEAYANLLVRRLVAAARRLKEFPESGRIVPEFDVPSIREVVWRSYRIVYRVRGPSVEIITVFHGALPLD